MNGLLGKTLKHSYSKIIHQQLLSDVYSLIEVESDQISQLLKQDFGFLNVTIPYKETVIPYLDQIDDKALKIGSVNTIIKRNNKIIGYNTDYDGFSFLLKNNNISVTGKNVLILGTGGASKTVYAVLADKGAKKIYKASRSSSVDAIPYDEVYNEQLNIQIIINTTPVGMYPNITNSVIAVSRFNNLEVFVDIIYNPYRTMMMQEAIKNNVVAINGLDMLIYQAIKAEELYFNTKLEHKFLPIKQNLISTANIALIGMPGSGKSTIGKAMSKILNMSFVDTDKMIEDIEKMKISDIFEKYGEQYFREREKEVIKQVSLMTNTIISTGGGAVMDMDNVRLLKTNSVVLFINRNINQIALSNDRPLTKSKEELTALLDKRFTTYCNVSDEVLNNDGTVDEFCKNIKNIIEEARKKVFI